MGKISQNPKIGQLCRPIAPQPYVEEKSWSISETPWPLRYNVEYTLSLYSLQCIPWPVACSVWPIFDFRFSGQITRKVKIFENIFPDSAMGYQNTFLTKFGRNRLLRSCWKVVWFTTQKSRALRDSSQPPFCPKWANRAQNYLNVVAPWYVYVYRIWSGSAAFCRTYSGKIDFSAQKVITIIGFQPTITQTSFCIDNKTTYDTAKWKAAILLIS